MIEVIDEQRGRTYFDLDELLGTEPPPPADYAIGGLLERSNHGLLCGIGGIGKTMFLNQLVTSATVEHPDEFPYSLGITVDATRIVWCDAEMGQVGTIRRYWRTELRPYISPGRIGYWDASGLDIGNPVDADSFRRVLDGADLVILDSLRRLCPTAAENTSDDMAYVVGTITGWAHELGPAILTIHHQGGDPNKWFRGSTAIRDACDLLLGWLPHSFDGGEDDLLRRLSARGTWAKVRHERPPPDRWFQQTESGLLVPVDAPASIATGKWDDAILALLPFDGTKTALAEACVDPNDPTRRGSLSNNAWARSYTRVATHDGNAHVPIEPVI
jgi:hypothetical protein